MQICFVCEGNTCRSPFAEKILTKYLKQNKIDGFKVVSCGLNVDANSNINSNIVQILKNYKINVKSRKPKKLTKTILSKTNLFVTMTAYQKQFIKAKNVFSLGELVGGVDIDDPYGQPYEYYLKTTNLIDSYIQVLIDKMLKLKERQW